MQEQHSYICRSLCSKNLSDVTERLKHRRPSLALVTRCVDLSRCNTSLLPAMIFLVGKLRLHISRTPKQKQAQELTTRQPLRLPLREWAGPAVFSLLLIRADPLSLSFSSLPSVSASAQHDQADPLATVRYCTSFPTGSHPFLSRYRLFTTFIDSAAEISSQNTGSVGRMTMPSLRPPFG